MHAVELFEQACEEAQGLGYNVRLEFLGGTGGGVCEFGGKRWVFIDLALNTAEQLEQIQQALEQIAHSTQSATEMDRLDPAAEAGDDHSSIERRRDRAA